ARLSARRAARRAHERAVSKGLPGSGAHGERAPRAAPGAAAAGAAGQRHPRRDARGRRAHRAGAAVVDARVLAALLMFAGTLRAAHAATGDELEYPVKTEFIERFTHFIDWPQTT